MKSTNLSNSITVFLSGDVMTGRGVDQVMQHPSVPRIHEPVLKGFLKNVIRAWSQYRVHSGQSWRLLLRGIGTISFGRSAKGYVYLAENRHGRIPQPIAFEYIWGDAIKEFADVPSDVRIVNLETSITTNDAPWINKNIHYRMNPKNIPCLKSARIDCCAVANNHVLDWGYAGLEETLEVLRQSGIQATGAGQDLDEAEAHATVDVTGKGRVLVFAFGHHSSFIPRKWAAFHNQPGVNLLGDLSGSTIRGIRERILRVKQSTDIVVASIHWGHNWGYEIPAEHRMFAHKLIEEAAVDVVHGHSSHHVKGIEVYRDRLILYGCGDLLNDYEGIGMPEDYRPYLGLMYFARINASTGKLVHLRMTPMKMKRFALNRASHTDALWLKSRLNREGERLGTRVELSEIDETLSLLWESPS